MSKFSLGRIGWTKSIIHNKHRKVIKKILIGLLVSGSLITYLLHNMDLVKTGALLSELKWKWLLVCVVSTCCMPLCAMCRWLSVIRAQRQKTTIRLRLALKAQLMANVFNSILPSKAGELAKAYYLKDQMGLSQSIGIVVLERLVDLLILGLLGLFGYFSTRSYWGVIAGSTLVLGSLVIILVTAWFPVERFTAIQKYADKIKDFRNVFHLWNKKPMLILQTCFYSLATWCCGGITVFALLQGLGEKASAGFVFAVYPLMVLAGMMPFTISGIGTREYAFVILTAGNLSTETATLAGIGYTFFTYWFIAVISLPVIAWESVPNFSQNCNAKK